MLTEGHGLAQTAGRIAILLPSLEGGGAEVERPRIVRVHLHVALDDRQARGRPYPIML